MEKTKMIQPLAPVFTMRAGNLGVYTHCHYQDHYSDCGHHHGCVGCHEVSAESSPFALSDDVPVVVGVEADKIESAKDAINAVFAMFGGHKSSNYADLRDHVVEAMQFNEPKALEDTVKIRDGVVALIADKILEKMENRVALIKTVNGNKPVCAPQKGDQIEYLVVGSDETSTSKDSGEPENPENLVVEDLKGPIGVMHKPRPKLV